MCACPVGGCFRLSLCVCVCRRWVFQAVCVCVLLPTGGVSISVCVGGCFRPCGCLPAGWVFQPRCPVSVCLPGTARPPPPSASHPALWEWAAAVTRGDGDGYHGERQPMATSWGEERQPPNGRRANNETRLGSRLVGTGMFSPGTVRAKPAEPPPPEPAPDRQARDAGLYPVHGFCATHGGHPELHRHNRELSLLLPRHHHPVENLHSLRSKGPVELTATGCY
ncbi:unnamed protein product [Natator depressus]